MLKNTDTVTNICRRRKNKIQNRNYISVCFEFTLKHYSGEYIISGDIFPVYSKGMQVVNQESLKFAT